MDKYLIGEVAKIFNISIDTLRYYDKKDIFKPHSIDTETNYRYYIPEQLFGLTTIIELKSLGYSLSEIKNYLDNRNIDMTYNLLKEQESIIQSKINKLIETQDKINKKIQLINSVRDNMKDFEKFIIKKIPKRYYISLNGEIHQAKVFDLNFIDYTRRNLKDFIQAPNEKFLSQYLGVTISMDNFKKKNNSVFNKLFILTANNNANNNSSNYFVEGKYLTYLYKGDYFDFSKIYKIIDRYIIKNNLTVIGDPIELSYIDSSISNNPEEFLTEIQILIK